jgi:hypothetical protein
MRALHGHSVLQIKRGRGTALGRGRIDICQCSDTQGRSDTALEDSPDRASRWRLHRRAGVRLARQTIEPAAFVHPRTKFYAYVKNCIVNGATRAYGDAGYDDRGARWIRLFSSWSANR